MEFGPIARSLLRHKTGALLVALQCCLTLVILANAWSVMGERLERMARPTGMDDANLFSVVSVGFGQGYDPEQGVQADLAALRALPGVVDATTLRYLPLSLGGSSSDFGTKPGYQGDRANRSAHQEVDEHGLHALGAKLVAGRNFRPEEVRYYDVSQRQRAEVVMLTEAAAKHYFPDGSALGKTLYDGNEAKTVIGIVEHLPAPWPWASFFERTVIFPELELDPVQLYLVRTGPGRRDELMPVVEQTLQKLDGARIVHQLRAQEDITRSAYDNDRAMVIVLGTVIFLVLAVTALGVLGLTQYNINRRLRQIGVRRALGATRGAILRYFLAESGMIASAGIALGLVLAVALNVWLVRDYQLPSVTADKLALGGAFVLALALAATLAPARRASRIAPATATRGV